MTGERALELLNGGDWACAWNERDALALVCAQLARALEPDLADEAVEIARAAVRDMTNATRRWARLAALVRAGFRVDGGHLIVTRRALRSDASCREARTSELLARFD